MNRELNDRDMRLVLKLGRQGVFYREIAAKIGRSVSTVHGILARHGIHRAAPKQPTPLNLPHRKLAAPVAPDGFIKAPTLAQLMARRA